MIADFRVWHSPTTQTRMRLAAAATIPRSNRVPHSTTPLLTSLGKHFVECTYAARESQHEQC